VKYLGEIFDKKLHTEYIYKRSPLRSFENFLAFTPLSRAGRAQWYRARLRAG
jgi:hypothetical protein